MFQKDQTAETDVEHKLRGYPVNMNFKRKTPLKTNGASSKLGFTVLLDPMIHDQINGTKLYIIKYQKKDFFYLVGLDVDGSEKVEYSTNNYFDGWTP